MLPTSILDRTEKPAVRRLFRIAIPRLIRRRPVVQAEPETGRHRLSREELQSLFEKELTALDSPESAKGSNNVVSLAARRSARRRAPLVLRGNLRKLA